jgi:hypothetical protein
MLYHHYQTKSTKSLQITYNYIEVIRDNVYILGISDILFCPTIRSSILWKELSRIARYRKLDIIENKKLLYNPPRTIRGFDPGRYLIIIFGDFRDNDLWHILESYAYYNFGQKIIGLSILF